MKTSNDNNKKKVPTWVWITAGALLLILIIWLMRRSSNSSPDVDQQAVIDAALEDMLEDQDFSGLENDDSPLFFTVPAEGVLTEDIATAIASSFSTQIAESAASLNCPLDEALEAVALNLLHSMSTGDTITMNAMELYMEHLNLWLGIYEVATTAAIAASAAMAESLLSATANSLTCIQTTYVKDVTESVTSEEIDEAQTVTYNRHTNGFLTIGATDASVTDTIISEIVTQTEERHIAWIPTCTAWGVTESALEANLAAYLVGMAGAFAIYQTVLDACPDPTNYVVAPAAE